MVVDIIHECADICEHEFDVEVELRMSGLSVDCGTPAQRNRNTLYSSPEIEEKSSGIRH